LFAKIRNITQDLKVLVIEEIIIDKFIFTNALGKSGKEAILNLEKTYVMVESYKNEKELSNLQCWALTCESFFKKKSGNGFLMNLIIIEIMNLFILSKFIQMMSLKN
jgi:hypothetical protein